MAFLDKSPAAAGEEAHQQRVFRARNCFNGFKNTCDASYVQPEVYGTLTKFCAAIQAERGRSSDPKTPNNTPVRAGTPANTKSVSKRPAAMTSGGKVSSLTFLILFSYGSLTSPPRNKRVPFLLLSSKYPILSRMRSPPLPLKEMLSSPLSVFC
jgi:hypothetical protein